MALEKAIVAVAKEQGPGFLSAQRKRAAKEGAQWRKAAGERFASWMKKEAPECLVGKTFEFDWTGEHGDGGAGLVAKRDLGKGEKFISIPRRVMLSTETAFRSKAVKLFSNDRILRSMPNLVLAMHLLFEAMNPSSYWSSSSEFENGGGGALS